MSDPLPQTLLVEETISPPQSPQASPHSPSEETNFRIEHLENPEHSRTFNQKTDLTIGRDAHSCSLVFPDAATLSRVHCKFFCLGREVFLTDVSSNGTFLNGKVVGKNNQRALRTNDLVSLINPQQPESTKLTWRFIAPEAPAALPSAGASDASNIEAHYKLGEVLGTGNFATVRLGTHRTNGRNVAVKIVEKKRFALQEGEFSFSSLQSEVEILRKMNHPNIIGVWDVYDDPKNFTMVLELVTGGDFFDYIVGRAPNPFTEDDAKDLFVQLLEAMLYMHDKDVVHRDLKPENILVHIDPTYQFHKTTDHQRNARNIPVNKVTLKVTDFGLAKFCKEQDVMTTMCGTPTYLAPEVLFADTTSKEKKAQGYSWSVDVWSLGVILYVMLSGCLPKDPQKGKVVYNKYMTSLSAECKDLLEALLKINPAERADLSDICVHPWLKNKTIVLRNKALKQDRLVQCGTLLNVHGGVDASSIVSAASSPSPLEAMKTSRSSEDEGTKTDVESDGDEKAKKRHRVEPKVVTWYWKKDLEKTELDPTSWQAYSEEDCERIEKAKSKGAKTAKVGQSGDYRISFEGMFQYLTTDTSKQRPVKRAEV
ncbi:protein kinase, putative [Bodo saltans]|uniref:Protein kinase, putative n=1 Tax=Bodo saltans TaxID=75058 RepID=A0A0S4IZ14_BODSA|nr:protein kinase, putative [Bodo saltans]|eukprot:CUG06578.1 protein kinase, putative [Bodo saltans]